MSRISPYTDTLGRFWSSDKLDRLLSEPTVLLLVEAAARAGYAPDRSEWYPARVLKWARDRYHREEPAGLLFVLVQRFHAIGLDPFDMGEFAE